ncbi:MAG: hypothetical protein V8R97_06300 [Fusicatenibacter saccharivorans]
MIPYYEDGKFHLFYLKNWNPYFGSDRKDGWHLLTTKDMVHYGPESAIGILGGTGSVIKADGSLLRELFIWELLLAVLPECGKVVEELYEFQRGTENRICRSAFRKRIEHYAEKNWKK